MSNFYWAFKDYLPYIYYIKGGMGMAIVYTKLFCLLEERGISLYRLKKMTGLADGTITSMRNNTSVTTDTLSKICRALCCQPGDITEYIEDSDDLHEI